MLVPAREPAALDAVAALLIVQAGAAGRLRRVDPSGTISTIVRR